MSAWWGWINSAAGRWKKAQAELQQELIEGFRGLLSSGRFATEGLPRYVFAATNEIVAGESQLAIGGETVLNRRP